MRSPFVAATALTLAAVVGCSNKERVTPRQSPPVVQQRDVREPDTDEPGEHAAVSQKPTGMTLAEKMAAYSRDMETQAKQRQSRKPPIAKSRTQSIKCSGNQPPIHSRNIGPRSLRNIWPRVMRMLLTLRKQSVA